MTAFAAGDTVAAGSSYHGGANGPALGNGNGYPTNGNGVHQHTVNGNGQQKPKEVDAGYPNGNGNGGHLGEQPTTEEALPPAAPTPPTPTEAPKKGTT
jgi:hypothetical protein